MATSLLALTVSVNASDHDQTIGINDFFMVGGQQSINQSSVDYYINSKIDKYFPKKLDRGDLNGLKSKANIDVGKLSFAIPGAESMDTLSAKQFTGGSFPAVGMGASTYWNIWGVNSKDTTIDFTKLYLNEQKLYVEGDKVVGIVASYKYWGCLSADSSEYGWNVMPMVLATLNKSEQDYFNNADVMKLLSSSSIYTQEDVAEQINHGVSKLYDQYGSDKSALLKSYVAPKLDRFAFEGLRKETSITLGGKECMVLNSKKDFSANLPVPAAVLSAAVDTEMRLTSLKVEKQDGIAIGVSAIYKYRGRVEYTTQYINYELPVLFQFSDIDAAKFSDPSPVKVVVADTETKPIRVLSLDGGGTRGVGSAQMIEEIGKVIKAKYNQELHEYFDVIVGTSTGGILAGAIGLGVTYDQLVDIYFTDSAEIFKGAGIVGLYDHSDLKNVLKKYIKQSGYDHTPLMSEAKTRIAVTAYEQDKMRNVLLTNEKPSGVVDFNNSEEIISAGNVSMIKALRATSSAPTYFKGVTLTEGAVVSPLLRNQGVVHTYSDGGCTTNNPTGKAYNYVNKLINDGVFNSNRKVTMISLGTGEAKFGGYNQDTGSLGFVYNSGLTGHLSEGAQRSAAKIMETAIKNDRKYYFHRFNFDLDRAVDLAAKDKVTLQYLRDQAGKVVTTVDFQNMLKTL